MDHRSYHEGELAVQAGVGVGADGRARENLLEIRCYITISLTRRTMGCCIS
jgi:hypothetical protein